ncbi:hypothetical protein [Catellatospora sichuanensis]|uniref:hypothetical protein n=1 Tax=Catellatospora sichuanensis TaxID=1969805 RepID=UPI0011829357|nr:hypothetical protein [Catellatospora sichuanensis]
MLSPSPDQELLKARGPVATTGVVIALVITRWRDLLAVLVPTLVPALAVRYAVAEEPITSRLAGGQAGWTTALLAVAWCLAVGAGVVVSAAALRGSAVTWRAALSRAARSMLTMVLAVLMIVVVVLLGAAVIVGCAARGPGPLIAIVPLVLLIGLVCRSALLIPQAVLHAGGVATVARQRLAANVSVLLGTAGLPLLVGLAPRLVWAITHDAYPVPGTLPLGVAIVAHLVEDCATVVAVALQAATLAVVYLQRHPGSGTLADLAKVDADLAVMRDGRDRPVGSRARGIAAAALVAVPALLAGGLAATGRGGPTVTAQDVNYGWDVEAVAWPAGSHPVIVTSSTVHWCRDDACEHTDFHDRNVGGTSPHNLAGIGPDRAVAMAAVHGRGGDDLVRTDGNDAVRMELCWQPGVCEQGVTKWHTGGTDGQPHLAAMPGRDGSVVVASAHVLDASADSQKPQQHRTRITLTRCNTVHCTDRHLTDFGTLELDLLARLDSGDATGLRFRQRDAVLQVRVDERDVPTVLVRDGAGGVGWIGTCDSPRCDRPTLHQVELAGFGRGPMTWLDDPRSGAASLLDGELAYGTGNAFRHVGLRTSGKPVTAGTLAATGTGVYALTMEEAPPIAGLSLRIDVAGSPSNGQQLMLWRCPVTGCDQPQRTPLWQIDNQFNALAMTVAVDGRVLIVFNDEQGIRAVVVTW